MFDVSKWIPWLGPELSWILQVFIIVLVTAVVGFIAKRLLLRMAAKIRLTKNRWDDILLRAMSRPAVWAVWLVGLDVAADYIYRETDSTIFTYSGSIRDIGILLCITWSVLGFIRGAEEEYLERSGDVDKTTVHAIAKLLRLVVMITSALVILQTMGYSIAGVLAMGGVGGIAVGFAAKDLLANFFGALIIYLDRPFAVGDWIRSPDRDIEGTVEHIGWRLTVIRNFQSRPLYVPNSVFTSIVVENPSRMANRRIYETIGLRYSDLTSMDNIVTEVKEMLRGHPEIDAERTLIVNFNEFADSSVDFFFYCFTKTTQWVKFHEVKQQVMLQIAEIIESNEAQIAFPTSTVHLADAIVLDKT